MFFNIAILAIGYSNVINISTKTAESVNIIFSLASIQIYVLRVEIYSLYVPYFQNMYLKANMLTMSILISETERKN